MKKLFSVLMLACLALFAMLGQAVAAIDLSTVTVDYSSAETWAGIAVVGLAAIWGVRKLIKIANRS